MPEKPKNKGGRPVGGTAYKPEYVDQVRRLALLGLDDNEMAEFFEVHRSNFYRWCEAHEDFNNARKEGKVVADARVAESLYRRAMGYSHPDTHFSTYEGVVTQTETVKYYPPDSQAAFWWLKNRQKAKWKDRQELTGPDGGPIHTEVRYRWAKPDETEK